MSVKLVLKEISVDRRQLMMAVQVHCTLEGDYARAPRIELVFTNGADDRRMVMPQESFMPKRSDKTGKVWIARARYNFFLRHTFWYGTWEECRLHFDIDFDGKIYESVPIVQKLRESTFKLKEVEAADEDEAIDDEDIEEEIPDSFEIGEDYIDIKLGVPVESIPPVQPNRIQVILGLLLRLMNGLLGLFYIPWYCIDVLGIIFLPTEKKDARLNNHSFISKFVHYVGWRYFSFCRNPRGKVSIKRGFMKIMYQLSNAFHRRKKEILFLSNRRNDLSGNFEYIYPYMTDDPKVKTEFWLNDKTFQELTVSETFSLAWKCGKAKVILVDDFVSYIRSMIISEETMIMQLWHACGAFKTFGFSRLGKKGGPKQRSRAHRDYDYCFVSSKNIAKYYAEGFGLAADKVRSFGVPRTDMFFDEEVKRQKRQEIYTQYPGLEGKKVLLFAPTFRGNGKLSAHYDEDVFDPNILVEGLPEDYVLIIKHHPFVDMTYRIRKKYANRIYDFSKDSEINDLLFITDVLITDYSSVIYEASLLNIPMLFFAYDLEDYIASRDFYFEYEINVPGKIVHSQTDLTKAILEEDYEHEKVETFCRKNFDLRDGQASRRIAEFIVSQLET